MMPAKNLIGMVLKNTVRSKRHFILSAFGIVIGIGAFVLFLSLTQKAGQVIETVFPVEEVEVVAPRVSTAESLLGGGKKLDDSVVETLRANKDVAAAVPRMALAFPAVGRGSFEGKDLRFEVGGFADGVAADYVLDGSYVDKDVKAQVDAHERISKLFKDWDADKNDPNRVACVPPPPDPDGDIIQSPKMPDPDAGKDDDDGGWGPSTEPAPAAGSAGSGSAGSGSAGSGSTVAGAGAGAGASGPAGSGSAGSGSAGAGSAGSGAGSGSGTAVVVAKTQVKEYENPCPNPDRYYCDDTEKRCKHRVPLVLSTTVVELYNNQFAKVHKMPVADKDLVNVLIQTRGLSAMRFSIGLGSTTVAGGGRRVQAKPRRIEAVVVGVSPRAMRVGVTAPIEYVRRWNKEFLGEEAASSYSSIVTTVKHRTRLAPFIEWLKSDSSKGGPGLSHEDNVGEKFASVVEVVRLLFLIISIAILVIAVINIGHNFFVQVTERRREIGIMRAVGASQVDVLLVILGEAAVIGVIGGLVGIGLALGIGAGWNWYAATEVAAFPHKPESWFEFKTWIWAGGLMFSTVFCILGGFLPARRAAKMEPAQALAAQ